PLDDRIGHPVDQVRLLGQLGTAKRAALIGGVGQDPARTAVTTIQGQAVDVHQLPDPSQVDGLQSCRKAGDRPASLAHFLEEIPDDLELLGAFETGLDLAGPP
ncbi:hypothetical protein RZS08_60975, partial [Arthrospira platensis SPKY1]|nr:hypothetical protein [Arthrospira platensis SPKY1]